MRYIFAVCCVASLTACATLVPNKAPSTAADIMAAQVAYEGLASAAITYIGTGKANAAQLKAIGQANEVTHAAVSDAVTALQSCSLSASDATRYDSNCVNGAVVQAAFTAAETSLQQFTTLLQSNGVIDGSAK